MKKTAMIAVAAMIAGMASADLCVVWKSQTGAVTLTPGGNDYLVGSRIDLLYSVAGPITAPGPYDVTLATETVLATSITGANSLWNLSGQVFAGDFTGGSFFTRVYETDGSYYEDFLDIAMGNGADYVYNPLDPATVYADNVVSGVPWVGANTATLIPEPATISLLGIAGVGMFIGRRRVRR